jgi:hypothetical protein
MDNKHTIKHLRNYIKTAHGLFSWPTDGCGYEQHIKFVTYRNENWDKYYEQNKDKNINDVFKDFVLEYINKLETENG